MNKTDLKKLRKRLPRSWAKLIAEKLNLSPIYVFKVLSGDRNNDTVILAAIDLAEESKEEKEKMRERIHSL